MFYRRRLARRAGARRHHRLRFTKRQHADLVLVGLVLTGRRVPLSGQSLDVAVGDLMPVFKAGAKLRMGAQCGLWTARRATVVAAVVDFTTALDRVAAAGGIVVDHEVIRQLVRPAPRSSVTAQPRGREVLALVAQRPSNAGLAAGLLVGEAAVTITLTASLPKSSCPGVEADRRVLAALTHLRA